MLRFRDDAAAHVAVRHAMHVFPTFVKKTRSDVFESYVGKARSEAQKAERTKFVGRVADASDDHLRAFEQKVADLGDGLDDGSFDSPQLAVMRFQQIQVETTTGIWADLSRMGADEDQRLLCVQYAARIQAFDASTFLEESVNARNTRLGQLAEGKPTLAAWAAVFRDDEIREKSVRLALYESVSYDVAVQMIENEERDICDYADDGEVYPHIDRLSKAVASTALHRYITDVLAPRMVELVNTNLVPNSDSVALAASAYEVAEQAASKLHDRVTGDVREDLVIPMVTAIYERRLRENEDAAEEGA